MLGLADGDFALGADDDFLAVEHRLIIAGVRSEWSRLRTGGACVCASQDSSHVGNAYDVR